MEEQRERARMGTATAHGSEDHHGAVLSFASEAPPTRFVGYEKLRAETSLLAVRGDDGRRLAKLEESPFYAEGGGQVADTGEVRWDGGSARVADVYRIGDDQALELDGPSDGLEPGRPGRGRGRPRRPPRDDAQPHRDAPAARGAPRAARDPRPPGGLRGAARQAALRLHPRRAALTTEELLRHRRPRQRLDQGEPPGARAGDVADGRRAARRDGAVRREVRRLGPGGRGRGRLARALRRHPRLEHGRDRDLRDRLRGLERRERAPDRGAHRPGRDRLVPRRARRSLSEVGRIARLRAGSGRRRPPREGASSRSWRSSARKAGSADLSKQAEEMAATGQRDRRGHGLRRQRGRCRPARPARSRGPDQVAGGRGGRGPRRGRGRQGGAGGELQRGGRRSAGSRRPR